MEEEKVRKKRSSVIEACPVASMITSFSWIRHMRADEACEAS